MRSLLVVVVHQIATNIFFGLRQISISQGRYPFRFQTPEQPLHRCVVPAVATSAHALCHSIAPEPLTELSTGILASLDALLRVKQQFSTGQSHVAGGVKDRTALALCNVLDNG